MSIYVMSDLHGLSNRFFTMLKLIDFQQSDHLYILGDVIDRGDDGIMLLQYIMQQENMTLLMGNHELMMLEYYETLQQGIPNVSVMTRWYRNGCEKTIQAFEKLTRKERKAMLAYLRSLPLAIADVKVRDKMYYLVHGAAILSLKTGKAYLDSDMMKLFTPADFVWNRVGKEQHFFDDRVVIFGHTMSIFYQNVRPYAIWHNKDDLHSSTLIAIDCGCANNDEYTRLCCLRLDDLTPFYV